MHILHIEAHLSSGVGRVLSSVSVNASKYPDYTHEIIILETQKNKQFLNECLEAGVPVHQAPDMGFIIQRMNKADIVEIGWWGHPKMQEFLAAFPTVPVRTFAWCYMSGNNYPQLHIPFIKRFDKFAFASLCSYDNDEFMEKAEEIKTATVVINCTTNLERFGLIEKSRHEGFNIGYVGTQNYCRLHPDFVDLCAAVKIPEARFILVGDDINKSDIMEKAKTAGIADRFEFVGYTDNVEAELARFDVFAYPMNPNHYGTTENSILEAMAAGLPVLLFNQCCEKYIVDHNQTGLLANDYGEYVSSLRYYYDNPHEREQVGKQARKAVLSQYTSDILMNKLNKVYDEVYSKEKRVFRFDDLIGRYPHEWFLSCLGEERNDFIAALSDEPALQKAAIKRIAAARRILREPTKGSVYHFHNYYPENVQLRQWAEILDANPFTGKF